jgi:hypothetical protein
MYLGNNRCKMCHNKKKTGEQYNLWKNSPHANAYKTLASEQSKKIAEENGIPDAQKAPQCLQCHVTAFGIDQKYLDKYFRMEDGVGCESCHGPGQDYYSNKVMNDLYEKRIEPETVGLLDPDEELCKTCHNENSPTYKGFSYDEFSRRIAHPVVDLK